MSDGSNDDGRAKGPNLETGVLANLPRTRPQRSSPRRTAARNAAGTPAKATRTAAKAARKAPAKASTPAPTTATGKRPSTRRTSSAQAVPKAPETTKAPETRRTARASGRREETVPRQGFESEGEIASGSVQPPGAAELVSSVAELAGELAKAGVTGGARLLKDLFTRLPPG